MWTSLVAAGILLLEVSAAYCGWRAISSARTAQGAMGWVLFLIFAPVLAVPLYLFFGHHRFSRYTVARRNSAHIHAGLSSFHEAHRPVTPLPQVAHALEKVADLDTMRGNSMSLLENGEATFEAIFSAIDAAEHYVLVQFYIFRDDALGRQFKDHLIAAAKRGVSVALLYDQVGSLRLSQVYLDELSAAGVKVPTNAEMRGPKTRFQINFRNHRKTVVVDGRVGFIGGHNVGDEYLGKDPALGAWRDTHIKLLGPVVMQLQLVFAEDWHWVTDEVLGDALNWAPETVHEDMNALLVPTGPADRLETGALMFFAAICAAKERVWIASPYFVPDRDILSALKVAAMRGVDVRLLLPSTIDHRIVWLARFAFFDEVRLAGVKIYGYQPGFMHQKVILVDDTLAGVGTTNLDNRSFRLNFEAMAMFFDPRAAQDVAQMLETDFQQAELLEMPLSEHPWHVRYGAPIARLFAPIL
ncbi:cardiolipin synthase [Shimia sp. R11_0]|uniref:cardiolipin synthase n=1 Tax=Shimia sp. R11_0 TaxID=2821096 RepID=UPI001ADCA48C|nr:cardiolipin synthase [Shimia sp. R11_0]MBO9476953.1 cardiolipin synthase [Shimia sp. R11_0]